MLLLFLCLSVCLFVCLFFVCLLVSFLTNKEYNQNQYCFCVDLWLLHDIYCGMRLFRQLYWTICLLISQSFTLELYFRQYWQDSRLAYKKPNKQITLSGNMADRLWQPDTFFENSKKGELHKLTTLNKVMVVKPDGRVFVSTRYKIDISRYWVQNCSFKTNLSW